MKTMKDERLTRHDFQIHSLIINRLSLILISFCSRIKAVSTPIYPPSSSHWHWGRKGGVWAGKLKCCLICPLYPLDIGSCRPLGRLPFPWGLVYGCFDLPPHLLRTSSGAERTSTEGAPTEGRRRYRPTSGGMATDLCFNYI